MVTFYRICGQKDLDNYCAKLRKKSDKLIGLHYPPYDVAQGWESQLIQALENSTIVAGLDIDLVRVENTDTVKALLPFLSTNRHMRKLLLHNFYTPWGLDTAPDSNVFAERVRLVLDTASENKGIEELSLGVVEPIESIVKAIQGTCLHEVTFTQALTPSGWNVIGQALKANPRLRTLAIHKVNDIQSLLHHLESHQALETLVLGVGHWTQQVDDACKFFIPALASFVAATTSLLRLKLQGFNFSETIEPVVEALKVNQSIKDLTLWYSMSCQQANRELSNFFQCKDAATNGIKHLVFDDPGLRVRDLDAAGKLLGSFLGPSLDSLTFSNGYDARFFQSLATSGVANRMPPRWHVTGLRFSEIKVLVTLLPQADKLTELDLSFRQRQSGRHSPTIVLLPALKQNWNLTRVSFILNNGEPYYKKESDDLKKMKVYCTRNAAAAALLSNADPSNGEESAVRHLVAPSLFALMAVQATKSSIHNVFKGVFAMEGEAGSGRGPGLGRCGSAKRARSDVASVTNPAPTPAMKKPRRDSNVEPNKKHAANMDAHGKPFARPAGTQHSTPDATEKV